MDGWAGGGDGGGMQKSKLETVECWKQRDTKATRKSLQQFCIFVVIISANYILFHLLDMDRIRTIKLLLWFICCNKEGNKGRFRGQRVLVLSAGFGRS